MSGGENLDVPQDGRRRGNSVGRINVGDTSPSLTTMHTSKFQRRQSDARVYALNEKSSTDRDIWRKLIIAFNELSYRQTWIKPFLVLIFSVATYLISDNGSAIHLFFEAMIIPSYQIEGSDQYGKGINDFYFVGFYALFFTFVREFMMCCVLKPLAIRLGIRKEAKVKRFMEQTYSMFYYGVSGPLGLYIMSKLPLWFFETTPFYTNYPHFTHDLFFKVYYLGQAAFWVQQSVVLVLQLEKPRKDFPELVLHHIITIALIWCSYRFHFTWMGLAVFITMDVSDFFLATSKTMNYVDSIFTGPFFCVFVLVWIYLRHYINLKILWSVLTEFKTVGEWELNWETQQYKCYISQPIVFGLIGALQLVNAYWLFLIFRILKRYIVGGDTVDERSDDESEEETVSSEEDNKKNQ
ncbi:acyl-CoA-dependent ceramide synthase [Suhomyces tanzawaensis NRRL Y-17324]|uniref:Acyl-CoA-dependent ceramide synthase n=1 Tax=Suhomyces tanzawaensis NRRL Y-17324 TaxID=984487 RepID=A0A1E4SFE1_9ASCO|nr:acyl-CoA-dependent ceramide synthase [Suhomyces tanzawaensis NRRL Y-17324]ODV78238.1 acyl-CoA-dependent ceramide synthase [Suhomyces tanzawaensis NRRL Y-17324]